MCLVKRRKVIYMFAFMKIQRKYEHWWFSNNGSYSFGFVVSKIRNFYPQRSVFVNLAAEFLIWHL